MDEALLERVLRRDRIITAAGLFALCALAWIYLIGGAGLGMSLGDMTSLSLFPHRAGAAPPMDMMDMPGMETPMVMSGAASPWSPGYVLLIVAMWQVMMVAMMTPSAAPMILLHSRVARHAQAKGQAVNAGLMASALFVAGYLLVWLLFSAGATALQWAAQKAGVLSAMSMSSAARWFSASLLIAAGLYQWTPLKHACLSNCRAPAAFLSRHWRPGPAAPLRLGALHGAYCVGCCWALMALLLIGGAMNPVWIAALALVVLAEKVAPGGALLSRIGGALLVLWGIATLVVP
jgi:predicted metal-binding membrane protein